MREIVKVYRDDWYPNPDKDGKSLFKVTFKDNDGLLYMQPVMARDELDAGMQVIKKEQTNGNHC